MGLQHIVGRYAALLIENSRLVTTAPLPARRSRSGSDQCLYGSVAGFAGGQVGADVAPGPGDVFLLLADWGNVVQGTFGVVFSAQASDEPGGQVMGSQAAASGRDVVLSEEWLVQYLYAGGDDPRSGCQVGAGRDVLEQAQPGQHQCAGALSGD